MPGRGFSALDAGPFKDPGQQRQIQRISRWLQDADKAFSVLMNQSSDGSGPPTPTGVISLNTLEGALSVLGTSGRIDVSTVDPNIVLDLPTTTVTPGSYGSGSQVAALTVDAFGRLTAAANVAITPSAIGAIGGSGTVGSLAVFTGTGITIGDSIVAQSGSELSIAGDIYVNGASFRLKFPAGPGNLYRHTFKASASATANAAYTWPQDINAGGTSRFLRSDGTGQLYWSLAGTASRIIMADIDGGFADTPLSYAGNTVSNSERTAFPAQTITLTVASTDNLNIGNATTLFLNNTYGEANVTGIAGGTDGRILFVINTSAYNIHLDGENAGSTAANRFITQRKEVTGTYTYNTSVVLCPALSVILVYSATDSRWRVMSEETGYDVFGAPGLDGYLGRWASGQIVDAAIFQNESPTRIENAFGYIFRATDAASAGSPMFEFYDSVAAAAISFYASGSSPQSYKLMTAGPPGDNYFLNSTAGQVLSWAKVDLTLAVTGTLPAANGGTGIASYTIGDLLYASGATALSTLAATTSGYYLKATGVASAPAWQAPAALTKTDDTNVTLTLGGSHATSLLNAASLTLGWTGTLAAARGGTGFGTGTLGDILYHDGSQWQKLAGSTDSLGQYLKSTPDAGVAQAPGWTTIDASDIRAGTLVVARGGTGLAVATQGDILYSSAANTWARLAKDTNSTRYLSNQGTSNNPSWNQVNLANGVTGQIANGNLPTDLSGHDHSSSTNQTRLAAKDRRRTATRQQGALAGTTALAESILIQLPPEAVTVTACGWATSGALTANDTNYGTMLFYGYDASGGTKVTLASVTTQITGGTGNWTAWTRISAGTVSNASRVANSVISCEITKTGTGVSWPAGQFFVEYTVD